MARTQRTPHALTDRVAAGLRAAAAVGNLTATDIAAELGTTRQRVARWLRGMTAIDTDELGRIAEVLGVDPVDLIRPPRNE